MFNYCNFFVYVHSLFCFFYDWTTQIGFAELQETADDWANVGGTIVGAPIVGQQLAQYILTDHQAYVGLLTSGRCSG